VGRIVGCGGWYFNRGWVLKSCLEGQGDGAIIAHAHRAFSRARAAAAAAACRVASPSVSGTRCSRAGAFRGQERRRHGGGERSAEAHSEGNRADAEESHPRRGPHRPRTAGVTSRSRTAARAGISAVPHADNPRYFDVIIAGPKESAYEGGVFKLEMFLPEDYPMVPPKVCGHARLFAAARRAGDPRPHRH
jgi:hypothetical protein